jgi:hypothetical protein
MLCALFLFLAGAAGALDFGMVLNQEAKASNEIAGSGKTVNPGFFYTPVLRPWVSGPLGSRLNLYLSGSLSFDYEKDRWRAPAALPQLDRSELTWLVSPALSFTLGRQHLEDPSTLAASGLFDGLSGNFSAGGGRFTAGAYYSGFLYKKQADILMTGRDQSGYAQAISSAADYFASRRVLASFKWENPGLGPSSSLALGLLGQFDLNEGDDRLHSQFFSYRFGQRLPGGFSIERAFSLGMEEKQGELFRVALAGLVRVNWLIPEGLDDRLGFRVVYSSHDFNERLGPFIPVNSLPQGQVFSPAIGSMVVFKLDYSLRILQTLSLGAEGSYFIRLDTQTFRDNGEPDALKDTGNFLGGEFFGTAFWTPLPDVALTFGGGAFFPRLGNAFIPEAKIRWKTVLGLILSF